MNGLNIGEVLAPKPTPVGIFASLAILKKRRARANALARVGMQLHGFEQDDHIAWSVFYTHTDNYLRQAGYFTRSNTRHTPKASAAINAVYEAAAEETTFKKNVF